MKTPEIEKVLKEIKKLKKDIKKKNRKKITVGKLHYKKILKTPRRRTILDF